MLLSYHTHTSRYETGSDEMAEQTVKGGGFGGFGIVGLAKNELALGISVTGVYVPNAKVRLEDATTLPEDAGFERDTWAFTLGPGVAYHPTEAFRIGGLLGLAVEQVPEFSVPADRSERLVGFGGAVWLGFDWELTPTTSLGAVALFENRVHQRRDVDTVDSTRSEEQSLTASIGVSLSFF